MVYSSNFEDAACRQREYMVYCDQCIAQPPVHTHEPCLILFVTEYQELSHGCKSLMGDQQDPSLRSLLEERGITQSQMLHIEYINVRDGGAFADNLTWLVNLVTVECNCKCFVFWNVVTSFLLLGGSVTDLYDLNKHGGSVVETVGVKIRSRPVDLRHKFVPVPLVYNKSTCDMDIRDQEMASENKFNPVLCQSFSKFMERISTQTPLKNSVTPTSS